MDKSRDVKINRVLNIFERLMSGEVVNKRNISEEFGVNERTIQRDIEDIRGYFEENIHKYKSVEINYSRSRKGYVINKGNNTFLNKEEALAISKILLESRAFNKEEMTKLINVILNQVETVQRKQINELICNELFNFVPLKHNKAILRKLWNISEIIRNKNIIEITYIKADGKIIKRNVKPVSIIFSEYYFYLIAYFDNFKFNNPTVFRIDRIINYSATDRKFYIPYADRFEEGEFRKRIQFMYQGDLIRMRFEFYGSSIDAILDRLPTASIIDKCNNGVVIEAEVFGKGIIMWLLSQGKLVKVISPRDLILEIKEEIKSISSMYETIE